MIHGKRGPSGGAPGSADIKDEYVSVESMRSVLLTVSTGNSPTLTLARWARQRPFYRVAGEIVKKQIGARKAPGIPE